MPPASSPLPGQPADAPVLPDSDPGAFLDAETGAAPFQLTSRVPSPIPGSLPFGGAGQQDCRGPVTGGIVPGSFDREAWGAAASALFRPATAPIGSSKEPSQNGTAGYGVDPAVATASVELEQAAANLNHLDSLKPLGQLRDSFILATGEDGLWIIDQHVAHERVLFEKILRDRQVERVQRQRLLMPMLVELKPEQMVVFARISEELQENGFEVEPFGPQTLAVKAAPVGLEGLELERTLAEVIDQSTADSDEPLRNEGLTKLRTRIAASIACHSAIKVNTTLDSKRIEWLLFELAKTSHPTSCPHGRPIALLYTWKEIQRAFHRI
jgi:DNA mismatch repair protein MutL